MTSRRTLLFYCQHAMGMGHLVRSLALADALSQSFRVVLLNGGELPSDLSLPETIEIINLPTLRLDNGQLISCDDRYSVAQAQKARTDQILRSLRKLRPEVLLTELYPFGRKKFEFELLPLLEAAKTQSRFAPLIVCSLRDILVSGRSNQQTHEERVAATANRWFDAILVHSDPSFARLEDSFHPRTRLGASVHHTGFVVSKRQNLPRDPSRSAPIVVSAGGGHYGFQLLSAALEAHALITQTDPLTMKVVAGPFLPEEQWTALRLAVDGRRGVTLVRSVPDLYSELSQARASVSQCGYNTAMEILQAQIPALVVPFADGGEDEQLKRARRLEDLGALRVLEQKEMTPKRMAEEIKTLTNFQPLTAHFDFDGARRSGEIVLGLLNLRQRTRVSCRGGAIAMSSMSAWLDPLCRALDESDTRIDFFFRDDDVGWVNDEFRALLASFRRHSVPLDIAVIPTAMTAELADEICTMRDEGPTMIGIHQHGFSHTNHEVLGRKCEFGISRTAKDQYRDIQLGKMKLEGMLGSALDPIFTPPWNRCTEITGECLRALGFRVLSRDATAPALGLLGLKEVPISIDWFAKKHSTRLSLECLGTLMANTIKQRKQPIGIMLHHELMSVDERRLLDDLLAALSAHPQARCNLMGEIAGVVSADKELSL